MHVPAFMQFHVLSFFLFISYLVHSFLSKQDCSTFFCMRSHYHYGDRYNTLNKLVWFEVQGLAKSHSPSPTILISDAQVVFQADF
jgi:hypothetical protein